MQDNSEEWVQRKKQEFIALKNALTRFEWGSAYIPEGCHSELYHIRRGIDRMDEPMSVWVPTPANPKKSGKGGRR